MRSPDEKPIATRNGLKVYKRLSAKTPLKSKKPMNKISAKRKIQIRNEVQLKKELLKRSNNCCEDCGRPANWIGLQKHEVIFRSHGGNPLDPDNCLILCQACHNRRHGL